MKLPLNIARRYTQLPEDIDQTVEILAGRVGEVESYKDISKMYENILVAEIIEKKDHPDADRLGVYQISIGEENNIQVLAGDKTLDVGDKVAYIKPGGVVPSTFDTEEPFTISSVKMRGILSNGMLCSQRELNIGTNHERVFKLDNDAIVGDTFANYYELNDIVIDIENKALTNRGDLFGIIGLARELSGSQSLPFESPIWLKEPQIDLVPDEICLNFDVDNQAQALCPRYCAIALSNIKVEQSPIWLRSALIKTGIKPINNIVDVTNYLMVITGQPMHAFDYDKVLKYDTNQTDMGHIVVRTAHQGEKIHALDDNVYELSDKNLVIANSQHPIAIAGMIGGVDTQIDEDTKNIILESANFDRYNLRRSSMELGIITDSSTRYTRSQSPIMCLPVLSKAVEMITELTGAKISSTLIDSYPDPKEEANISINIEKLNSKLGLELKPDKLITLLENIEYTFLTSNDKYYTFQIPVFRTDIEIEEDIYEDVARTYGYNKITPILPTKPINSSSLPKLFTLKNKIRDILSNSGCNELITYNFVSSQLLQSVNQDPNNCIKLQNPISKDLELMRSTILISLLDKARLNLKEGINTFAIYEIGLSHQKDLLSTDQLPLEEWKLALIFSDNTKKIEGNSYYQAKRYLEKVLDKLNIKNLKYRLISDIDYEKLPKWSRELLNTFEPNTSAFVSSVVGDTELILGVVGEINNQVKENLSLNNFTCGFEINLESLQQVQPDNIVYMENSKYPYISQDICFTVPDRVTYQQLLNCVKSSIKQDNIQNDIECIDIYKEGGSDSRKITLRIAISNTERTLKDKDYLKIREVIEKKVGKLEIKM
jgi:phenylalanyl-tRNA synthetase beta chain